MGPGGVPGEQIGSVDASMVNKVTAYLSKLIRENDLPQKLVVVHQFTDRWSGTSRTCASTATSTSC